MRKRHAVILTTKDYSLLQDLLSERIGERSTYAWLLRRKLGSATVMASDEVGADVAMSGRRIHFQTSGASSKERLLSWGHPDQEGGRLLSLLTPSGMALLGMTAGQSISIPSYNGRRETLLLESVRAKGATGRLSMVSGRGDTFATSTDPRADLHHVGQPERYANRFDELA